MGEPAISGDDEKSISWDETLHNLDRYQVDANCIVYILILSPLAKIYLIVRRQNAAYMPELGLDP